MMGVVGCNKPKVISDRELSLIFHDAMLTNSYIKNVAVTKSDSVNIYEPILASYGYTVEDLQYTLVNFSRRKSARLSDVAEEMILRLEREAMVLQHQVSILDTIDNVARRHFTQHLLDKSNIKVTKDADSLMLRFDIPIVGPGDYRFECSYTLDSLDKTTGRRYHIDWLRQDSTTNLAGSGSLTQGTDRTFNHTYTVRETDKSLGFILSLDYVQERKVQKGRPSIVKNKRNTPRITVENVKVIYTPAAAQSVERLYKEQLDARIWSDTLIQAIEQKQTATN